jgi:hypothetical protein
LVIVTVDSSRRSRVKPHCGSLKVTGPEAEVDLAADMTSTLVKVAMDSIRDRHQGISKRKLFELTRKRIQRRPPIWIDDAFPYFSEPGRPKLIDLARKWKMTYRDAREMLKGLKGLWSRWKHPSQ